MMYVRHTLFVPCWNVRNLEAQIFRCQIRCFHLVRSSSRFGAFASTWCPATTILPSQRTSYTHWLRLHEQIAATGQPYAEVTSLLDATDQSLLTKRSSTCVLHCFSMFCCRLDITHGLRSFTALGRKFAARCRLVRQVHLSWTIK